MKINDQDRLIKYLRGLISRLLIVIIIFLGLAICFKTSSEYQQIIKRVIYEENLSFVKIKKIYDKYLGGIVPLEQVIDDVEPVFNEELDYTNDSVYYDGAKLEVINNYLVPVLKEGMVIFVGEKENYGNVVIIEGVDGIDIWYGNLNRVAVKLYDYVDAGDYLGETVNDMLYLVYSKDNKFLDYKEYLK